MHLDRLTLLNFKNHREMEVSLTPGVNCFVGPNGVGKTNLLDAVHYLSLCKSYFHAVDQEHVHHDEELFMIKGLMHKDGDPHELYCSVRRGHRKVFKHDKKEYDRLADHVGRYPVVMISPYDAQLVLDGSDVRRRSLDALIAQFDRNFLDHLMRYNKALAQRNQLLKQMSVDQRFSREALEPWNEQLVEHGEAVHAKRAEFMDELVPLLNKYYVRIGSVQEVVGMEHRSHLNDGSLRSLLEEAMQQDRRSQHTTVGVHKDDLVFTIGGRPLKRHGSQGQQKTYLVAWKLAHLEMIARHMGAPPILLLDDIFDKLDPARVERLLATVAEAPFGQILITDTDPDRTSDLMKAAGLQAHFVHLGSHKQQAFEKVQ